MGSYVIGNILGGAAGNYSSAGSGSSSMQQLQSQQSYYTQHQLVPQQNIYNLLHQYTIKTKYTKEEVMLCVGKEVKINSSLGILFCILVSNDEGIFTLKIGDNIITCLLNSFVDIPFMEELKKTPLYKVLNV